MTLVEVVGHQYLRMLALEETVGRLQDENSRLREEVVRLTPQKTEPVLPTPVPYKGAIDVPCSACGDGDVKLEHHDHEHVPVEHRVPA